MSARPLVPFFAVTAFVLCALLAASAPEGAWLLAAMVVTYAAVVVGESLRVASKRELALVPALVVIFPVMHACHGFGFWAGLLRLVGAGLRHAPVKRLAPARPEPREARTSTHQSSPGAAGRA